MPIECRFQFMSFVLFCVKAFIERDPASFLKDRSEKDISATHAAQQLGGRRDDNVDTRFGVVHML